MEPAKASHIEQTHGLQDLTPPLSGDTNIRDKTAPFILRIKRPAAESPVELFDAVPSKRLRKGDVDVPTAASFRYIGTVSSSREADDEQNFKLDDMGAVGKRKLLWCSFATAHVVDPENTKKISYKVNFSGAKRKLPPSIESQVSDSDVDESMPSNRKSLRVIDLLRSEVVPLTGSDPLAMTLNGLQLVSSAAVIKEVGAGAELAEDTSDIDFVYDIYYADDVTVNWDSETGGPRTHIIDQDEEEHNLTDDSDSNSESNWRNDYPDEEDTESWQGSEEEVSDDDWNEDRHKEYRLRLCNLSNDRYGPLYL